MNYTLKQNLKRNCFESVIDNTLSHCMSPEHVKIMFGSGVALLTEFLENFPFKTYMEYYGYPHDPSGAEDLKIFVSNLKECPTHVDIISKGNACVQEKPMCTWQVYVDAGKCWIQVT